MILWRKISLPITAIYLRHFARINLFLTHTSTHLFYLRTRRILF